ncbi:MAG: N-acetyltransferase, partial [Elusimicrobiota bacterium]
MNEEFKIRKADLSDVRDIHKMINGFAKKDVMLPRSLNELYDHIRDFWVAEHKGKIIACCAFHPMWEDMAEIKSLAVKDSCQGKGLGEKLIDACLKESDRLKVKKVFALTYIPEFFEKYGFSKGDKEKMPHKIWSECIK